MTSPLRPASLSLHVLGLSLVGPGFTDWPQAREALRGSAPWALAPTALPHAAAPASYRAPPRGCHREDLHRPSRTRPWPMRRACTLNWTPP